MARQSALRNSSISDQNTAPKSGTHTGDLHLGWLPAAEKSARDRRWEQDHPAATYRGVPPELHTQLKTIANELEVTLDDVARAFLEFGLWCFDQGELQIEPVLNQKLTLFPKGKRGWYENGDASKPSARTKKRRAETPRAWRFPRVSYRLPTVVREQLDELRQQKHVPIGEVLTLLFSHALADYENGRLVLQPQPRQPASLESAWSGP